MHHFSSIGGARNSSFSIKILPTPERVLIWELFDDNQARDFSLVVAGEGCVIIPDRLAAEIAAAGTTRRRLAALLIEHGFSAEDQVVLQSVKRIQALRKTRRELKPKLDPLETAKIFRPFKSDETKKRRHLLATINFLLSLPIAAFWRSDRRDEVAGAYDPVRAYSLAITATLEAVSRLAVKKWGFVRRHTSKSSGAADSRYLSLAGVGEVRISDHEIPVYGERAWRYDQNGGGPRWAEIIVGHTELAWTLTRWRREMILHAAGRR